MEVRKSPKKEKKAKKKEYEDWTKEEVRDWIDGIGGSKEWKEKGYGKKFFDRNIVGKALKVLTEKHLEEKIGVDDFGDQMLILSNIREL